MKDNKKRVRSSRAVNPTDKPRLGLGKRDGKGVRQRKNCPNYTK